MRMILRKGLTKPRKAITRMLAPPYPSVGRRSIEGDGWGAGSSVMAGGRSVSLFAFVEIGAGLDMGPSASFSFWKGPLGSLSGWTLNGGFGYGGIGGQYSLNRRGSGGSFVRYQKSGIAITGSYAERIGTVLLLRKAP
jgi:hypothetical protein